MGAQGMSPDVLRPGLRVFSRWALSPSLSWPTTRRRVEVGLRFPGPPRDVMISSRSVGGVPCEVHRPPRARYGESTTLYLHGGGWTFGSALAYRSLAGRLAKALRQRVVVPDYRLTATWPHEAHVADVRAVWDAVSTEVGQEATTVAGDSAGGQPALVLALALKADGRPLPRALGLICPAVDMTSEALAANGPGEREPLLMRRCYAAALQRGRPARAPVLPDLRRPRRLDHVALRRPSSRARTALSNAPSVRECRSHTVPAPFVLPPLRLAVLGVGLLRLLGALVSLGGQATCCPDHRG